MQLTTKQIAILRVVLEGNGQVNGNFSPCDLDQIMERVGYNPTKHAIHFSIRKLIAKGLIFKLGLENRRDRRRILISPTDTAIKLFESKENNSYIETTDEFLI